MGRGEGAALMGMAVSWWWEVMLGMRDRRREDVQMLRESAIPLWVVLGYLDPGYPNGRVTDL